MIEKLYIKFITLSLNFVYFFLKLLPTQNKIVMMSRFSNEETLDFRLLREKIEKTHPDWKIVILTKKLNDGLLNKVLYSFYMIKQMYHLSTSHSCIVDSYIIPVSVLQHKSNLRIIQIWHALGAVKQFGYQVLDKADGYSTEMATLMKMHKNYDYVVCSGPGTVEAYSKAFGIPKEKIVLTGMPRLDYLKKQKAKMTDDDENSGVDSKNNENNQDNKQNKIRQKLHEKYPELGPIPEKKKNIVYMPTFRKGYSQAVPSEVEDLIDAINYEKYNLILSFHPSIDTTGIKSLKAIVSRGWPLTDLLSIADFIVTDYSAVAFEAMIFDKPLFFYLYDFDEYSKSTGLNINWFDDLPEYTFDNAKDLVDKIQRDDYNMWNFQRLKDKYLSALKGNSTERVVSLLEK